MESVVFLPSSEERSNVGQYLMMACSLSRPEDPSGDITTAFAFPRLSWEQLIFWTNRNTIITTRQRWQPSQSEITWEVVIIQRYETWVEATARKKCFRLFPIFSHVVWGLILVSLIRTRNEVNKMILEALVCMLQLAVFFVTQRLINCTASMVHALT